MVGRWLTRLTIVTAYAVSWSGVTNNAFKWNYSVSRNVENKIYDDRYDVPIIKSLRRILCYLKIQVPLYYIWLLSENDSSQSEHWEASVFEVSAGLHTINVSRDTSKTVGYIATPSFDYWSNRQDDSRANYQGQCLLVLQLLVSVFFLCVYLDTHLDHVFVSVPMLR